jgi:hypothetical protein
MVLILLVSKPEIRSVSLVISKIATTPDSKRIKPMATSPSRIFFRIPTALEFKTIKDLKIQ